jgi:hypothetical protein
MGSTLTNLVYHVIFSTKDREPPIIPEIRDELHLFMGMRRIQRKLPCGAWQPG